MAVTEFTGPVIVPGNIDSTRGGLNDSGASLFGDGTGIVDPRSMMSVGAAPSGTPVYGFYDNNVFTLVDQYPQAPSNTTIANQALGLVIPSSGSVNIPLTVTNGPAIAQNVPLVPFVTTRNSSQQGLSTTQQAFNVLNQVLVQALDFGACQCTLPATGTTTPTTLSNNSTAPGAVYPAYQSAAVFPANQLLTISAQSVTNWNTPEKFFYAGQKLVVSGAGNAGGTTCLLANVVAIDYVQHFIVLDRPVLNTAAVGGVGVGVGSADRNLVTAWPYQAYDATAQFDCAQGTSRTLSVTTTSAGDTGITVQVVGFDCYGVPMTENITSGAATTTFGVKAFKYILSANATKAGGLTTAGSLQIGTTGPAGGATFGFPIRVDQFEYTEIWYNGAAVTANTGFTAALSLATNPVPTTAATADVRGTYAVGATAPNGARKLTIYMDAQQYTSLVANSQGWTYFYGNVQT